MSRIGGGPVAPILLPMKRGRTPLWLLRDLPALVGLVLSFWPLMIMVITNGRRAMRGQRIDPGVCDALMQMLPLAEARPCSGRLERWRPLADLEPGRPADVDGH